MTATISKRLFMRPEIDEPCPDWARPLLPLSIGNEAHVAGIANERVPQETAVALYDLFPMPPKPMRDRKREESERRYKPYIKAWAVAVYFALLQYALAKQVSLFPTSGGETTDVAILCFRGLSDLANKLGISYDRLQKWMTVLLIFGFVKRFREGRHVLYILPLAAYAPAPSSEAVLKKLDTLIESQYIEKTLPDGRVIWLDRCPEWTTQLIEIRSRFVLRYQPSIKAEELLAPHASQSTPYLSSSSAKERLSDQAFQSMLHEVSQAIPEAVRLDIMRGLFPVLARSYVEIIESTPGKNSLTPLHAPVAEQPREKKRASTIASNLDIATIQQKRDGGTRAGGSQSGVLHPGLMDTAEDGQSRFDAEHLDQGKTRSTNLQGEVNVADPALTEENVAANAEDAEKRLRAENRKKAELLANLLHVPGNVNRYTKFFNQVSRGELGEDLIKACFAYTLYQERAGEIMDQEEDRLGKYFYGVFRRWSPHRTYGAACRASTSKKWNSRTPPGIRPRDKEIIDPFMPFSYEMIAQVIRAGKPTQEIGWLPSDRPLPPMDCDEAESLVQEIREQAAWYLQDPVCRPLVTGTHPQEQTSFVVDAWQDNWAITFTSRVEWQTYHEQMLTHSTDSRSGEQNAEETYCGPVAGEGLNVQLEDGRVLTYEEFQVLFLNGAYSGECVEVERDRFIPLARYEELLASGEFRHIVLEDGTPVSFFEYPSLINQTGTRQGHERGIEKQVQGPSEMRNEQQTGEALEAPLEKWQGGDLPGWLQELSTDWDRGTLIDTETVEEYKELLQEVLDPQLYQMLVQPTKVGNIICFVIELSSLCSGWRLRFEKTAQVEKVLDLLQAQQEDDREYQEAEKGARACE